MVVVYLKKKNHFTWDSSTFGNNALNLLPTSGASGAPPQITRRSGEDLSLIASSDCVSAITSGGTANIWLILYLAAKEMVSDIGPGLGTTTTVSCLIMLFITMKNPIEWNIGPNRSVVSFSDGRIARVPAITAMMLRCETAAAFVLPVVPDEKSIAAGSDCQISIGSDE